MGIAQLLNLNPTTESKKLPEKKADVSLADFIPYAAFLDEHTIITKNGELMQTIKITTNRHGLPTEDVTRTQIYLRNAIRDALKVSLKDSDFSVWMHVLRDRSPLAPLKKPDIPFAAALQDTWLKKQRTKFVYQNVCYVTILVRGKAIKLFSTNDLKESSFPTKNRRTQEAYTTHAHQKLDEAMESIFSQLSHDFGANYLAIVPRQNAQGEESYYSEQMEFLHRIMNLDSRPMPVKKMDLSAQLATHEMIFGFDALETKLARSKRFASIVSIKHWHELPSEVLDRFIQMPAEMVITQSFNFVSAKKVFAEMQDIKNILKESKDGYIAHASGFLDMLEANKNQPTDFAEQQTTIMLMVDHYPDLDGLTTELQSIIAKMGLVSVREDIKFEEVFWSQMPGNFEFIRRKHIVATSKACGLARLNYYLIGALQSHWGEPITIFPTNAKTPYLFHFHHEHSGHTVLVDYNSFPDSLSYRLTHFLCASASKQAPHIIMFDRHGSGKMFAEAMHGDYLHIGSKEHNLSLNPLSMPSNPQNQGFLAAWMAALLSIEPHDSEARAHLKACVAQGWDEHNNAGFPTLVQMMQRVNSALAGALQQHLSRPVFAHLFASGNDNFHLNRHLTSINLNKDCFTESSQFAAFALLLHRIILSLDGKPTLIVIKEAWDLLDHPFFASRLASLGEMLTEQNAALFMTTRDIEKLAKSSVTQDILNLASTKIFMPDDVAGDQFANVVGLSETEDKMLLKMERQKGEFIIKHGNETIPTHFKIDDTKLQAILLGDAKTLHGMRAG